MVRVMRCTWRTGWQRYSRDLDPSSMNVWTGYRVLGGLSYKPESLINEMADRIPSKERQASAPIPDTC